MPYGEFIFAFVSIVYCFCWLGVLSPFVAKFFPRMIVFPKVWRMFFLLVVIWLSSIMFALAVQAQELQPQITSCGAPMKTGQSMRLKDVQGRLVMVANYQDKNTVVYKDKYGKVIGRVKFNGDVCEIKDAQGRLQYRGKWYN